MIRARLLLFLLPGLSSAGFRPLPDWAPEGPGNSFSWQGGELRSTGRGHVPNWLRSREEYEDFRLRFDYNPAQWAEMAVLLRAPRTARPQHAGAAVFLGHDFHNKLGTHVTGAILNLRPPLKLLPPGFGQWRKCEIELRGARLRLSIDGHLLQDSDLPEHRLRRGFIGFADMGYPWRVRNVEIEDLGRPTQFLELFNTPLDQWEKRGDSGEWTLEGGVLTGANGHSILYAPPVLRDFELTLEVRSHRRTNSGVFLRGLSGGKVRGFEVQIYSPVDAVYPTGSIYNLKRSAIQADLEERWFLLQVRVEGQRVRVWIDGEPAAETSDLPEEYSAPGRIGFQIHLEDTSVEFRAVRVREIRSAGSGQG